MAYFVLSLLGKSLRYEFVGKLTVDEAIAEYPNAIVGIWHDNLTSGAYYVRNKGFVVLTSKSRDPEFAARCAIMLGYGIIRGSSSRRARTAMKELIKVASQGLPTLFTVDGPRGPYHVAKPGPVMLSKITGNPIIPAAIFPVNAWQTKSWDKHKIPKPFSRVIGTYGEPIYVSRDAGPDEIEQKRRELQQAIEMLTAKCAATADHDVE
ncbi:MAG: lysophospholipid acyltransferase family protein [Pyrinomonadaceae bacterium]